MRTVLSAAAVLAATLTAANAHALISAGVLVGQGFKDGYNFGLGARAGITLPAIPIYVGGTFVYHLGKTVPGTDVTAKVLYGGIEGGYEIGAIPLLTIRPYLGLGYASLTTSSGDIVGTGEAVGSLSSGKLALWPGATVLVTLAAFFVGIDGRYVVLTDVSDANAFTLFGTAGLSF